MITQHISFSLLVKNKQALTISRGIFSVISILLILIALLPINLFLRIGAGVLSLPFLYISLIIIYSYYQFSDLGGDFQSKIHNLIVSKAKLLTS